MFRILKPPLFFIVPRPRGYRNTCKNRKKRPQFALSSIPHVSMNRPRHSPAMKHRTTQFRLIMSKHCCTCKPLTQFSSTSSITQSPLRAVVSYRSSVQIPDCDHTALGQHTNTINEAFKMLHKRRCRQVTVPEQAMCTQVHQALLPATNN